MPRFHSPSGLTAMAVLALSVSSTWAVTPWTPDVQGNYGNAPATFNKWEAITVPVETGASCGNGTPYRFFVNRTTNAANKNKTVVMFEGGGACWSQNQCKYILKDGMLGATNYPGIPTNYMSTGLALGGLVTPFTSRNHPLQKVQTQSWNIVYVPYCTGDVHTGNKVGVFDDVDPKNPLTYSFHGYRNSVAVANWLGKYFPNQDNMLITGFSAGGAGATSAYGFIRLASHPKQSALLADSGPLFQVNRNDSPAESPSVHLHNRIRTTWGLDGEDGIVTKLISTYPTAGSADNLGSLSTGLARIFPNDRLGFATFQQDMVYSAFSYVSFYPEIAAAPAGVKRDALLNAKWMLEINKWVDAMDGYSNIGYYIPFGREFLKSHTMTTASFANTAIKEDNLANVGAFVDNLLDPSKPLIKSMEKNPKIQKGGFFSPISLALYAMLGL